MTLAQGLLAKLLFHPNNLARPEHLMDGKYQENQVEAWLCEGRVQKGLAMVCILLRHGRNDLYIWPLILHILSDYDYSVSEIFTMLEVALGLGDICITHSRARIHIEGLTIRSFNLFSLLSPSAFSARETLLISEHHHKIPALP